MSWQTRFGELRSLVHGEPSGESWEQIGLICDAAPSWRPEEREAWREQGIPYLRDKLAAWPRALCAAPWWDTQALLRGKPTSERFPIARTLARPHHVVTTQEVQRLAQDERLRHIEALSLTTVDMTPVGFEALCRSPFADSLVELDVHGNSIGEQGATALAESALLGRLTSLNLAASPLGKRGVKRLLGQAALGGITERLNVSSCALLPSGLRALAANPRPPRPIELNLGSNAPVSTHRLIDPQVARYTIREVVCAQTVAELRGHAWIDACHALVSSPVIARAQRLHLHAFVLDAAHMVKLVERAAPLTELQLTFVDPEALAALVTHPGAAHIKKLGVHMTRHSAPAILEALSRDRLEALHDLSLYCPDELPAALLDRLCAWPRFHQIESFGTSWGMLRLLKQHPDRPARWR